MLLYPQIVDPEAAVKYEESAVGGRTVRCPKRDRRQRLKYLPAPRWENITGYTFTFVARRFGEGFVSPS